VVGGVVGAVWGRPFWGPPHSPHACWIDNHFYRHCRWSNGHWYHWARTHCSLLVTAPHGV